MDPLEPFHRQAERLAEAIRGMPSGTRWFLHCDTDADGLCAAAVTALALQRLGHRFQVRASREKTRDVYVALFQNAADGYIVLDKGTSHLAVLAEGAEATKRPVLVVDHHNLPDAGVPEGVLLLNPREVDLDGSNDACSSTSALALAQALHGDAALAWSGIALVGAIGDWQHMGGWDGWNREIVATGAEAGTLVRRVEPALVGPDIVEAIARREHLAVTGLAGDPDAVRGFLTGLGVPVVGDVEALDRPHKTALVTGLALKTLAEGGTPEQVRRLVMQNLEDSRLGGLRHVFRIVDACGRQGKVALGLAYLMGDETAREEAMDAYESYRTYISAALERLRSEGTVPRRFFHHFSIDDAAYTGMVGGLGMTVVLEDKSRPMCVTAPRPDGDLQVSTRGTDGQVARGLDLGRACQQAAGTVGREGGGHPVAAGTVIDPADLDAFLDALDEALESQGFLEAA